MTYNQRALYDKFISFYLITCDDEEEEKRLVQVRAKMGALVRKARNQIPQDLSVAARIHQLIQLVYNDWGFYCDADDYFFSRNLYLPYVLKSHRGMPVSLGAIVLYLAHSLDLPIYPVNFPTQLILRAEVGEFVAFIDPWDGSYLSHQKLQQLYEGTFGFGARIQPHELDRADIKALYDRFHQLAKNALIREDHNDMAFRYIEFLIREYSDPHDIRDRGLVLAQMGAYPAAMADLTYFVDHYPNDPTARLIQNQLVELKGEIEKTPYPLH